MIHGYIRVSTRDQNKDMQFDALAAAGVERFWEENASGMISRRPVLVDLLDTLVDGDTLVVYAIDRLGRSLIHLMTVVAELTRRGVEVRFLREQIDPRTPMGRCQLGMFAVFAQYERDLIVERTLDGFAAARARGHKLGRRPVQTPDRVVTAAALRDQGMGPADIAQTLGVSRATVYRMLGSQ